MWGSTSLAGSPQTYFQHWKEVLMQEIIQSSTIQSGGSWPIIEHEKEPFPLNGSGPRMDAKGHGCVWSLLEARSPLQPSSLSQWAVLQSELTFGFQSDLRSKIRNELLLQNRAHCKREEGRRGGCEPPVPSGRLYTHTPNALLRSCVLAVHLSSCPH